MPLSIHRLALKAAEAAQCAREQGRYWEMHQQLFANQRNLEPWNAHAEVIGLDLERFESCISSGNYVEEIRRDLSQARELGATGTPSFVLAETDPDDPWRFKGISFIRGAQRFDVFKAHIESALAKLDR